MVRVLLNGNLDERIQNQKSAETAPVDETSRHTDAGSSWVRHQMQGLKQAICIEEQRVYGRALIVTGKTRPFWVCSVDCVVPGSHEGQQCA